MDTLHFQIRLDRQWPDTMGGEMRQFLSDHKVGVIDGNYSLVLLRGENGESGPDYLSQLLRLNCLLEPGNDTAVIKAASREYGRLPWNALIREFIRWSSGGRRQTGHTSDCQPNSSRQICLSQESKRTGCISKNIYAAGDFNPKPQIKDRNSIKNFLRWVRRQRTSRSSKTNYWSLRSHNLSAWIVIVCSLLTAESFSIFLIQSVNWTQFYLAGITLIYFT